MFSIHIKYEEYILYIYIYSTQDNIEYIYNIICIGYTMRMRGYRIYTTEGEARGRVYSMTPNPNCITGLYQNAEAFPFPIGSSLVSSPVHFRPPFLMGLERWSGTFSRKAWHS